MSETFNPFEYRQNLADKIRSEKNKIDEEIQQAEASDDFRKVRDLRHEKREKLHKPLKLAKWSEEYWRARLMVKGNFEIGKNNEVIDNRIEMTAQEMADLAKLKDVLDYSIDEVVKILPELDLSDDLLNQENIKNKARQLFWLSFEYEDPEPQNVIKYVKFFKLGDTLQKILDNYLNSYIEKNDRSAAELLSKDYPEYIDISRFKKMFKEKFYPMPEGLSGRKTSDELLGSLFESAGKDPVVAADKTAEVLQPLAMQLAEDLKKNPAFYGILRGQLSNWRGYAQMPKYKGWWIMKDDDYGRRNECEDEYFCRVIYFLNSTQEDYEKRYLSDEVRNGARLEFHFSCSNKDALSNYNNVGDHFGTTNIYKMRGLYFGNTDLRESSNKKDEGIFVRVDQKGADLSELKKLQIRKESLKAMLESLLVKEKDFSESIDAFLSLAKKFNLPDDEIEDMVTAIKEFGTYEYKIKSSSMGDCLVFPNQFASFCSMKFGIKLEEARYGEKHPEYGNQMGYEPYNFYHEVNVCAGKIVIDWTVTQFAKHADKPIPYIYEVGTGKGLGPLYKRFSSSGNPNEIFLEGDPEEREIIYGI